MTDLECQSRSSALQKAPHRPQYILQMLLGLAFLTPTAYALEALPVPRVGPCPTGYLTSGGFCQPGKAATFAVAKTGSCPSGYQTSGAYCLAGRNARHAVPLVTSCPSGYAVSGAYCLGRRNKP